MMKCFRVAVLTALAVAALAGCASRQAQQEALPIAAPDVAQQNSTTYSSIYSFGTNASIDGQQPKAGLTDVDGTLYGTTYLGGKNGDGTVFSITTAGAETVLYSFKGSNKGGDGKNPSAGLIAIKGLIYGTTEYGGTDAEYGTVFSISTSGTEKVLYRFQGYFYGQDGANPVASLINVNGKLYGTTYSGGAGQFYGTAFRINTKGKEKVLHSFVPYPDGAYPAASLLDVNGVLYGTTVGGGSLGSFGSGTVFSITPSGTEQVIHAFSYEDADGDAPDAALIDVRGTLYGTAQQGGAVGNGTVFSITTGGKVTLVHSFDSQYDGNQPNAPLFNVNHTLYGTTRVGGSYGKGTIFSVTLSGKEKVLHSFGNGSDGSIPLAGLIDVNGTLYGTTSAGGTYGNGTVFALKLPR
jgi:uncharacterized repeat protein (TIGR03803 family)